MTQVKGLLLLGMLLIGGHCFAAEKTPDNPKACTTIKSKLERLYCFDNAFLTPVVSKAQPEEFVYPAEWRRAVHNEKARDRQLTFLQGQEQSDTSDVWLTAPAIGAERPRPILMLSCINDISRVELVLPKPFERRRVNVAINGQTTEKQSWVNDSSGHILRSGRGVPAIRIMKKIFRDKQLTLRSNNSLVDGLQFDATGLRETIQLLRDSCEW